MVRILMVCMGNICRSPMAQAIGTQAARLHGVTRQFAFDSAGTHPPPGAIRPDPRARSALEQKNYETRKGRARAVVEQDFQRFDLILGLDHAVVSELRRRVPAEHAHKIRLFLDFAPGLAGQDVPDPYYGNAEGFHQVLALCEQGVRGLLELTQA